MIFQVFMICLLILFRSFMSSLGKHRCLDGLGSILECALTFLGWSALRLCSRSWAFPDFWRPQSSDMFIDFTLIWTTHQRLFERREGSQFAWDEGHFRRRGWQAYQTDRNPQRINAQELADLWFLLRSNWLKTWMTNEGFRWCSKMTSTGASRLFCSLFLGTVAHF